jgi:hypothetical protein
MNTYKVKCVYRGPAAETIEAEHSFAARKAYAAKNGCELLECYAKRVRGNEDDTHLGQTWSEPVRSTPSLATRPFELES